MLEWHTDVVAPQERPRQSLYAVLTRSSPFFMHRTRAQLGEAVTLGDSTDVVREGEVTDGFYVVTSGSARVQRGGGEVALPAPGDYFGELSLFDPAPGNATVTSADGLSCVMLSRAAFTRALDQIPAVRDALLHGMARRVHELDQRV
jgi:CRP-like cAMP-binding protein